MAPNPVTMLRYFSLVSALALSVLTAGAQDVTGRVTWLAGCWEARDGARTTFEMWSPPSGGMLVGAGRTVVGGRQRGYEHLRLHAAGDTLVYTAIPSGQTETEFKSTSLTDSSFVVENKSHDFPQRITYRRAGTDSLVVQVEGPAPNGTRAFSLKFVRTDCSAPSP